LDFSSGVVEQQRHDAFARVAVVIDHFAGTHVHAKLVSIRRPAQRAHRVAERSRPAHEFFAEQDAALLPVRLRNPDVVPLKLDFLD
jgi:hypothetical protein